MIRAIYFVLFFSIIGQLSAQKLPFTEVIYLKNGSVIRGVIIEIVPNTSYKIKTADNSVFVFEEKEIIKIAREFSENSSNSKSNKTSLNKINTTMEAGYGAKSGQYGLNVINVNALINYQLKEHISVSGGIGMRRFEEAEITMIPVFVDGKISMPNKDISPYLGLAVGYSLNVSNGIENSGVLVNPQLGIQFKLNNGIRLNLGTAYQTQQMPFLVPENIIWVKKVYRFSESFCFNVGVTF
jgi:long-subunit fatty acid transport protein